MSPESLPVMEPIGTFRWLHDRCGAGHSSSTRTAILASEAQVDWSKLPVAGSELAALVGTHAWAIGTSGNRALLEEHWSKLHPVQRGRALAGLSENADTGEWVAARIGDSRFDAVSLAQIGCNAIMREAGSLLPEVLDRGDDLAGAIRRFSAFRVPSGRFDEIVRQLSGRAIDLILEAALVKNDEASTKLALAHGADPNIPVWCLERSFNERRCPLSQAIEAREPQITEALLAAGANPRGIPFCTPNLPLFEAISAGDHELALRLLAKGACFADTETGNQRRAAIANAREKRLISPASDYFFGHFESDLSWALDRIGSLVSLVPVGDKPCFYMGTGQGGYWRTFLDAAGNDVAVIKRYEALGLDTRLTAEELLSLVRGNAYDNLLHLLRNEPETVQARVLFRVRRRKPSFGEEGPMALRPQDDGASDAVGFDPGSQKPLILPDGSALFVDLEAIAPADHAHGPCLEGHFWHRREKPERRRRRERTIVRRLGARWEMARKPRTKHPLEDLLPVVRRFGGRFIRLGCSVGKLGYLVRDENLAGLIGEWRKSPEFQQLLDEAIKRIAAQDQANARPPAPVLTQDELDGYPREFWPFLDRLPSGLIGIREDMAGASMSRDYRAWERQNKREDSFVPDPRVSGHRIWNEVPPELKPYLVWDSLFERPGFQHRDDTDYDRAMSRKATLWWNEWITPKILEALGDKQD